METQKAPTTYTPTHHVRIVTAASLFDGHDAAINLMRRVMQSLGAEIIHLGHNRSAAEVVETAIQEDAQGIALTSYQGGHVEYFKYMYDLLQEKGACIKLFGGGGGTILPQEIEELHNYGIDRVYSPDDGRQMGLQGMIEDVIRQCDFPTTQELPRQSLQHLQERNPLDLGKLISFAENHPQQSEELMQEVRQQVTTTPVLGITGTGGSGKSSLIDELVRRFLIDFPNKQMAILSVDPSRRKTGGALLGDRIRMNSIHNPRVYMRSLATRQANLSLSKHIREGLEICKAAGFDFIILETSGIGQSDTEIVDHSDATLYVMTAEYGAASQLEKIDMLDYADLIAINKFDKRGSRDALRDVSKQFQRNQQRWDLSPEQMPVFGTMASQFNDPGLNRLYLKLFGLLSDRSETAFQPRIDWPTDETEKQFIIPPEKTRYLSEIVANNQRYDEKVEEQAQIASRAYRLKGSIEELEKAGAEENELQTLRSRYQELYEKIQPEAKKALNDWQERWEAYQQDTYDYHVRDKTITVDLYTESLSGSKIPKVAMPKFHDWGDIIRWNLQENVPGAFPFTAGVFPFKRSGEDPARMFAGEGGPEKTNKRFHYLSLGSPAKRLSTAFDSVTLYGENPDHRPDIYGKIGNSGVSIATLDDAKKLYSGFDLCDPKTSVSMTINGPAPMILAFFLNAAIDQQCELYLKEQGREAETRQRIQKMYEEIGQPVPTYNGELPETNDGLGLLLLGTTGDQILEPETYQRIKAHALNQVRGTVQADILKEDQAQNTCIFSTEFALRMMGDIQQYFIDQKVRNFYSVSISGYHIAEAGANPITQLAFTLANGFTLAEYYLSRGMHIDEFAPNFSYFFSNGMDPEYAVIGRVARKIWAKAMRDRYGANERSQKLKYHIQTSGRSLHAQEIAFNDIRTTLQALYAIYDNCNSLHTNAYDEAITTPTEESVRRALAIQLIINKELGLAQNENPNQGSFIIEELTNLVEEAVYAEFERLSERGGVLGAMERMYQRSKIQEESMYYETLKHNGEMPVIGVNTFLGPEGSPTIVPEEIRRSTQEEREFAINTLNRFKERNAERRPDFIKHLQETALQNGNIFESLMEAVKACSLGELSEALYEVGGQYRRNM